MAYISAEEVKNVRNMLKNEFPNFKFSVSGGGSLELKVAILKGTEDFSELTKDWSNTQINQYHLHLYGKFEKLFEKILKVMKSQDWFDESDSMTDYFHTAYYVNLSLGKWDKPYEMVK
jgi:hypothetical protein